MQGGGNQRMSGLIGKAGEHAVACQLMLRGLDVGFLGVGVGKDLIAENGCRIQVKSGHVSNSDGRAGRHYSFITRKGVFRHRGSNELMPRKPFAESCDIVVFWGIEENRFWIMSPELCDGCYAVRLGADLVTRPRLVADIKSVRDMVDLGYSQSQIAKHYGTSAQVIQRFIAGGKDWDESTVSKIRSCENDWGKILNFVRVSTVNPVAVQEG